MNKKSLIKYGVATLVLAAAAIALVTVVSIKPMDKEEEGMGLTVDPYSGTYTAPEKAETEEDSGGIAIPGWGSIRIKAGEKLVDVASPCTLRERQSPWRRPALSGLERAP